MTHTRKYTIIDVETNETLNWKPAGRFENIGLNGAKSKNGEPAKIAHFTNGETAIVWIVGDVWNALTAPGIAWSRVFHGDFSEKMERFLMK